MITNGDCVQAGKIFADTHGDEAWRRLCEAWCMSDNAPKKEVFLAGLAMGFVEALKTVRDSPNNPPRAK